jgi:hypothetical protein
MTTVNYYIEDLATGLVVMNSGENKQFTKEADSKLFNSYEDALSHIDTLPNGDYRIFSRITKS